MRRMIRWADAEGRVAVGVELDEEGHFYELVGTSDPMRLLQGESFEVQSAPVIPVDPYSLELGFGLTLLPPLDPPEVWCAGVTYERSRDARMEESASRDVYADVYALAAPRALPQGRGRAPDRRARGADRDPRRLRLERPGAGDRPRPRRARARSSATRSATTSPRARSRARTRSTSPRRRSSPARARSARPSTCRRTSRTGSRSSCASPTRTARSLYEERTTTAQMVRSFDELVVVARARQPGPARYRPPHRDGARAARRPHPRARALGRDPRPGDRHARQPRRPRVHARLTAKGATMTETATGAPARNYVGGDVADGGVRRDVREAQPLAAVGGHRRRSRPRAPTTRARRSPRQRPRSPAGRASPRRRAPRSSRRPRTRSRRASSRSRRT